MFDRWRKNFHEQEYQKGQEAVAEGVAADRYEDHHALTQRMLRAATDTIRLANELAADEDPIIREMADYVKVMVAGGMKEVAAGKVSVEASSREALENHPFSETSPPTAVALPSSAKSLPPSEPSPPVKRGRGRPRKNPRP